MYALLNGVKIRNVQVDRRAGDGTGVLISRVSTGVGVVDCGQRGGVVLELIPEDGDLARDTSSGGRIDDSISWVFCVRPVRSMSSWNECAAYFSIMDRRSLPMARGIQRWLRSERGRGAWATLTCQTCPGLTAWNTVHFALTKTHSTIGFFLSMCTEREEGGEATTLPCSWCCGTGAVVLPNATVTSETPHLGQPELWKPWPMAHLYRRLGPWVHSAVKEQPPIAPPGWLAGPFGSSGRHESADDRAVSGCELEST